MKSLTDSIVVVNVARSFDVTRSHHKQIKLKTELKTPPQQQRMWRQKSPCRLLHGNSLASGTKEEKLHNCVSLDHIHEREPSTKILIEILLCFSRHCFIVVVFIIRVFFLMRHKNKYMTELAYNISQAIIFILPSQASSHEAEEKHATCLSGAPVDALINLMQLYASSASTHYEQ